MGQTMTVMKSEYRALKEAARKLEEVERKLNALEEAGVDNWEGYSYAMEILRNSEAE